MLINKTLEQRGSRYGTFEDNARLTQALLITALGASKTELSPMHREALHMIFHKIARMCSGDQWYADNAHDIAGYATLLEEYIVEVTSHEDELS
jgi:hypothetical protein